MGGDISKVTLQVYLHDVPESFGGATTLFPSTEEYKAKVQPRAGSVLLFTQDLPHEGSLLSDGLKYTLRTEAMYTRREGVCQSRFPAPKPSYDSAELGTVSVA